MIDSVSSSSMSPWCFMSPISFCLNQDPKKRIVRKRMQVVFQHGSWFQGLRLSAVQYSCEKEAPTTPVLFTSNSQLGIARLPQDKAFFATQLVFSPRKSEWLLTKNSRWVQRAMVWSKLHCSTVARMQKHFPTCPVMNCQRTYRLFQGHQSLHQIYSNSMITWSWFTCPSKWTSHKDMSSKVIQVPLGFCCLSGIKVWWMCGMTLVMSNLGTNLP